MQGDLLEIFLECMWVRTKHMRKGLVTICGDDFHSNMPLRQERMMLPSCKWCRRMSEIWISNPSMNLGLGTLQTVSVLQNYSSAYIYRSEPTILRRFDSTAMVNAIQSDMMTSDLNHPEWYDDFRSQPIILLRMSYFKCWKLRMLFFLPWRRSLSLNQ